MLQQSNTAKLTAATTLLGLALFLIPAAPRAYADDRADCQHHIEKAEARVDEAARKYGPNSRQVADRQRDLNAERQRCWDKNHAWYNAREHRWETQQNWEGYDHDHDHDQH